MALAPESCPRLVPRVRLQLDPVSHKPVLLFPEGILELNETAHAIVQLCDGAASVREIVAQLAVEYEVPEDELQSDVTACIEDLQRRQLLVLT